MDTKTSAFPQRISGLVPVRDKRRVSEGLM